MSDIPPDKIILEINPETTAKIEVLVEEGLYPNQVNFIEQAIRNQLNSYKKTFKNYEKKSTFVIGVLNYSAKDLEKYLTQNKQLEIRAIGVLRFEDDVTPELVNKVISKVRLAGRLWAPKNVVSMINERRFTLLGKSYKEFKELDSKENQKRLLEE